MIQKQNVMKILILVVNQTPRIPMTKNQMFMTRSVMIMRVIAILTSPMKVMIMKAQMTRMNLQKTHLRQKFKLNMEERFVHRALGGRLPENLLLFQQPFQILHLIRKLDDRKIGLIGTKQ